MSRVPSRSVSRSVSGTRGATPGRSSFSFPVSADGGGAGLDGAGLGPGGVAAGAGLAGSTGLVWGAVGFCAAGGAGVGVGLGFAGEEGSAVGCGSFVTFLVAAAFCSAAFFWEAFFCPAASSPEAAFFLAAVSSSGRAGTGTSKEYLLREAGMTRRPSTQSKDWGSTACPSTQVSRCRFGPVTRVPVAPTEPSCSDAVSRSPVATLTSWRWL